MPLNTPIHDWSAKRVWVIGASTGIGAAIARELLARGARVAVSARRGQAAGTLPAADRMLDLPLDVTVPETVHAAARTVIERFGQLDLVLVVAGTHEAMRAQDWSLDRARRLLEVNLHGVLNCLDAVLPILRAQRAGGVAIFSSIAGYAGLPKALVYGPSKAALINLAESLYGDLHPEGIGVYLVNPGFVDTPLTARNDFRMPSLITAEQAAAQTLRGIERGLFEIHYPKRFTLGFKLLRLLPYRLQFWLVRRITGG
ncbi:MAG TPA: SDR family NAD(P)-dependent oxidoreductase [Burkholderiaceae bacterium]